MYSTSNSGYAVIDIETTGLFTPFHDILEIGVVLLDANAEITHYADTLVKPKASLAATHIHRITADMIEKAPWFEEIASNLISLIDGRVLVAHNASLDKNFLSRELKASIGEDGLENATFLDTLTLARKAYPTWRSHTLSKVAAETGATYGADAHSALADALTTAEVFKRLSSFPSSKKFLENSRPFHSEGNFYPKYTSPWQPRSKQKQRTTQFSETVDRK